MLKKVLIFALFFISLDAFSQSNFKYGVDYGIGISNFYGDLIGSRNTDRIRGVFSFHLGAFGQSQLNDHLHIRPALRLTLKGIQHKEYSWNAALGEDEWVSTYAIKAYYVELPIKFTIDFGKKDGFTLTGGLLGGVALGGSEKYENVYAVSEQYKVNFSGQVDNEPGIDLKPLDASYILGIGYKIDNVVIDLELTNSLFSAHPEDEDLKYFTLRAAMAIMLSG